MKRNADERFVDDILRNRYLQKDERGEVVETQQQMYMPQQHVEVPSKTDEIMEFVTDSWWFAGIFIVGLISCAVVSVRVFKKNPWVDEFIRMWRTR